MAGCLYMLGVDFIQEFLISEILSALMLFGKEENIMNQKIPDFAEKNRQIHQAAIINSEVILPYRR